MAKEHLIKARELIANGWTKGGLYNRDLNNPCYCLDGAIVGAHDHSKLEGPTDNEPYEFLAKNEEAAKDVDAVFTMLPSHLRDQYINRIPQIVGKFNEDANDIRVGALYRFNDTHARDKADVLAVLDKAIANYPENGVDSVS